MTGPPLLSLERTRPEATWFVMQLHQDRSMSMEYATCRSMHPAGRPYTHASTAAPGCLQGCDRATPLVSFDATSSPAEGQQLARHLHITVIQGFGGPQRSSSCSCTCICITDHFFSLTDTAASASAILLQHHWCDRAIPCPACTMHPTSSNQLHIPKHNTAACMQVTAVPACHCSTACWCAKGSWRCSLRRQQKHVAPKWKIHISIAALHSVSTRVS
jgi:hypothetical protein